MLEVKEIAMQTKYSVALQCMHRSSGNSTMDQKKAAVNYGSLALIFFFRESDAAGIFGSRVQGWQGCLQIYLKILDLYICGSKRHGYTF